jgi:hypothetical protein
MICSNGTNITTATITIPMSTIAIITLTATSIMTSMSLTVHSFTSLSHIQLDTITRVSLHWKTCIAEYYKICQPGELHDPNLWMRKTVDAIWQIFLKIWITRNGELFGKNYEEQRAIALEMT